MKKIIIFLCSIGLFGCATSDSETYYTQTTSGFYTNIPSEGHVNIIERKPEYLPYSFY